MADIERIKQVVALIEEDEELHQGKHFHMEQWVTPPSNPNLPAFCNTTMCFAGWTVIAKMGSLEKFLEKAVVLRDTVGWEGTERHYWEVTDWADDGIGWIAQEWLGINDHQAYGFFYRTHISNSQELKENITDVLGVTIWPEFPHPTQGEGNG